MWLCRVLSEAGAEVTLFGSSSEWPARDLDAIKSLGVRLLLPPAPLRRFRKASLMSALASMPLRLRRRFVSVYCIGDGRLHNYVMRSVLPGAVSIFHEILQARSYMADAQWISTVDAMIANSKKVGREMADIWPSSPIRVLPFLTSGEPLSAPVAREPVGTRELRIVYLGRLAGHKRPDMLVKNWLQLKALKPLAPARLDIYGYDAAGTMINELQQFVAAHDLTDAVEIHGAYDVSKLPEILSRADVVVLPSEWEGLPLVLVEAMQRGVPIVATCAGGTEEFGEDNPDVIVTDCEWESFVDGLLGMAGKLRSGGIDAVRLHRWTEERYGYAVVAEMWRNSLLNPRAFFGLAGAGPQSNL
jgi:glycosyltransferase involved in cell wall biosynthesis